MKALELQNRHFARVYARTVEWEVSGEAEIWRTRFPGQVTTTSKLCSDSPYDREIGSHDFPSLRVEDSGASAGKLRVSIIFSEIVARVVRHSYRANG